MPAWPLTPCPCGDLLDMRPERVLSRPRPRMPRAVCRCARGRRGLVHQTLHALSRPRPNRAAPPTALGACPPLHWPLQQRASVCFDTLALCIPQMFLSPRPLGLGVGWWRPTARSRLVTGWSRRGGPCAVTAGHAQSRRCGSRHGRHGRHGSKSPGRRPIPRHAGVARPRHACLRDQRCVRSVRRESQRPLEPSSAASPSGASLLT